jgi:hypothetical protein
MIEIAGDHVGASTHHGLERIGPALELDHLDIDAGLVEFAELLGQHRGQIAQARRAAYGERDLRLRESEARRQQQRCKRGGRPPEKLRGHGVLPDDRGHCVRPVRGRR